jgi:hypothetical protein
MRRFSKTVSAQLAGHGRNRFRIHELNYFFKFFFSIRIEGDSPIMLSPGSPNRVATFCRVPGDRDDHNGFEQDHLDRQRCIVYEALWHFAAPSLSNGEQGISRDASWRYPVMTMTWSEPTSESSPQKSSGDDRSSITAS